MFTALALLFTIPLSAHAAPGDPAPVTIRVTADLPYVDDGNLSNGPTVWEVTDITPGPDLELDNDDLVSNPTNWFGAFIVDIDPDAGTISVYADPNETGDFQITSLTVTSADLDGATVTLDQDELYEGEPIDIEWSTFWFDSSRHMGHNFRL